LPQNDTLLLWCHMKHEGAKEVDSN
jgi:hypothetical protein